MSGPWKETPISGVFWAEIMRGADARGSGMKILDAAVLRAVGIEFIPVESLLVTTRPGVLRGMHGQRISDGQSKLITCTNGLVHDVILDVRLGSPSLGRVWSIDLSSTSGRMLYVPPGILHGFCVTGPGDADVLIQASAPHTAGPGIGVRWDSFNYSWPCIPTLVSERDAALPEYK